MNNFNYPAQNIPAAPAWFTGVMTAVYVAYLLLYVYAAYCLQRIARKLGAPNTWMAWIPIANVYYVVKLAGKPGWWFILMLIPFVNVVVSIVVLVNLLRRLSRSGWGVILLLIPIVNLVYLGVLAFGGTQIQTSPVGPSSQGGQ